MRPQFRDISILHAFIISRTKDNGHYADLLRLAVLLVHPGVMVLLVVAAPPTRFAASSDYMRRNERSKRVKRKHCRSVRPSRATGGTQSAIVMTKLDFP